LETNFRVFRETGSSYCKEKQWKKIDLSVGTADAAVCDETKCEVSFSPLTLPNALLIFTALIFTILLSFACRMKTIK
jgi:hypothetical protein